MSDERPVMAVDEPLSYGELLSMLRKDLQLDLNVDVLKHTLTDEGVAPANIDGLATVPSMRTLPAAQSFSAYSSAGAQLGAAGANAKVTLNTVDYDLSAHFSTVNSRFQPNVAGYFQIDVGVNAQAANTDGDVVSIAVFKNGAALTGNVGQSDSVTGGSVFGINQSTSATVFLNGTTDYVELWGVCKTNANAQSGVNFKGWMTGSLSTVVSSTALILTGTAGGDLVGSFPSPTIKADVTLTGNPTTTTQAVDNNTTRIATTAFVIGQAASANPLVDASSPLPGTSTRYARADHVHPTDTSRMSATVTWGGDLTGTGSTPNVAKINGVTVPLAANPWTAVVGGIGFQGTWANLAGVGDALAGYFKDPLGFVHLRGRIKSGATGTTAFTLPAGFRPGATDVYAIGANNGGGNVAAFAVITAAGALSPFYASAITDLGLGGITFLAEN